MKSLRELREFNLRVQHQNLTVKRFHKFNKIGLIDWDVYLPSLDYNLQRDFVWTLEQKQELIWSVLLDRDISKISVISIAEGGNERLQIIDGKQRLNALLTFMDNDYYINFDGFSYLYGQLEPDYKLAISLLHLDVGTVYQDIDKPMSDKDKINWFNRINFAGTPQDMTHQLKLKGLTE